MRLFLLLKALLLDTLIEDRLSIHFLPVNQGKLTNPVEILRRETTIMFDCCTEILYDAFVHILF